MATNWLLSQFPDANMLVEWLQSSFGVDQGSVFHRWNDWHIELTCPEYRTNLPGIAKAV